MDCEDHLSEKYPHLHKTPVSVVPTLMEETSRYFSFPARFVWTKPAKKERLSHVSQAAKPRDEVDMEVASAGKLADSESSEAADEEEDPFSLEGNVQDHVRVKALKIKIRQFEAGSMTVCEDLMEERKELWNATRSLSAARADVNHLKEELENHKLYSIPG